MAAPDPLQDAVLIGGNGQYADRDKAFAKKAHGRIVEVGEADDHVFIRGDATEAYAVAIRTCFPAARKHTLVTLVVPYPASDVRRIFSFTDDQGFSIDVYFNDVDDRRFRIALPKDFQAEPAVSYKSVRGNHGSF